MVFLPDMHRCETSLTLENYRDYVVMAEEQFGKVFKVEEERVSLGCPSEEELQTELYLFEERFKKDFPSKLRYSFVVLLQIIFETRLKAACDEIVKRKGLLLKERDLKGAPLERAKMFLHKVAYVRLKSDNPWQELNNHQKVRDCIVHANGEIALSRDKSQLEALSRRGVGISINDEGFLDINREYCNRSLEMIRVFFEDLFDSAGFGLSYYRYQAEIGTGKGTQTL